MQCYEQFGWKPQDIYDLPEHEAKLLSIYFEETMAHQAKKQRELDDKSSGSATSGDGWYTEYELGDDPQAEEVDE